MAVFEKKNPRKVCLDDTETLTATIESTQNVNGHTEYIIKVQRGPSNDKTWFVCKRYNDFVALHSLLQVSGIALSLPPKKLIGNMERNFIAERQSALQNYLHAVLINPHLSSSLGVRKFLDPYNYAISLQEQALQHVSMALRSETNYELLKPVPEMGWRLRKHYFSVSAKNPVKSEVLLQWCDYGPDKCLQDKEIQSVFKYLTNLNHPNLGKIEYAHFADGGCFVIRQFNQIGSLRDLICCAKPKMSHLKKYGNPRQMRPVTADDLSIYGRQILEALIFLNERGIPYGHLHLGNVLIVDNAVKLLDIENSVLGLPARYRPFILQHKKINTMEAIDVYSFGHVLYEMTFGHPLLEPVCDNLPSTCPASIRSILESILTADSCKLGMPSLRDLIQHPFFSAGAGESVRNAATRMNSAVREYLKLAAESVERRLRDEQKMVRLQKKMSKMQKILSSDEKIEKIRERLKDERKSNHQHHNSNNNNNNVNSNGINNNGDAEVNSKCSPRSGSPTSTSTATSAGTVTPPFQASKNSTSPKSGTEIPGRSALLDSICSFNKSALRQTNPSSAVRVTD